MVLNVSILGVTVERVKVEEGWDVRVSRRAMVAFVEVVRGKLPVVVSLNVVCVIEVVVGKVNCCISLLHIDIVEVLFPAHFRRFLCVHVDPDEAVTVDLRVDLEETILFLIEVAEVGVTRSLGQLPVQTIRPSMVPAGEDLGRSFVLAFHHRIGTMPAHIVECINVATSVASDDDVKTGDVVPQPVTGLLDPRAASDELPPT